MSNQGGPTTAWYKLSCYNHSPHQTYTKATSNAQESPSPENGAIGSAWCRGKLLDINLLLRYTNPYGMASSPDVVNGSHAMQVGRITENMKTEINGQNKSVESINNGYEPDGKEKGVAFWTKHTKPVMTSLLKNVGIYTPAQQSSHIQFLEDYIVPSMGRAPEPTRARSLMTPNGSPFETSLNQSDNRKSSVRFCYEPVFPPSDGVTESPIPAIAEKVGADLRWFNQFAAEFFPNDKDAAILTEQMPKDTIRIPNVFLAFDLDGDKRNMKAYFYPVIKYMTSKLNSDRAGFDLIRRLEPLGPSFGPALDVIENYHKLLYQDPPLTVVIGLDCVRPEDGARIKIYTEPRTNTWAAVQQHVTLGGQLTDQTTLEGLAILRDMWNIMINEPEDKPIDEHFEKEIAQTMPKSSGVCFSWELKPGDATPDTKIYVALRQFYKNDKSIVQAMEKVFRKREWDWGIESAYKKVVSDAYGSDVVDDQIETPTVHTFISFSFSEKKGAYMTTYLAPFVRFPQSS